MPTANTHYLIHVVGHHELYLDLLIGEEESVALHENFAAHSTGKALLDYIPMVDSGSMTLTATPTGGRFHPAPVLPWNPPKLRERLEFRYLKDRKIEGKPRTAGVRWPILSSVLQAVQNLRLHGDNVILQLVTAGPTDAVEQRGSSTKLIGDAIEQLLKRTNPGVDLCKTKHLDTPSPHTYSGISSLIEAIRDDLSEARRAVGKTSAAHRADRLKVHLSLNTGPIPVILGLLQGLEEFKPGLIHVENARQWPQPASRAKLAKSVHLDYDQMRQAPEFGIQDPKLSKPVRLAIDEMVRWRRSFVKARPHRPRKGQTEDADQHFFFRKGAQEVLAVVVVRHPSTQRLVAVRGVNLEVSLPTGTLCAERNAIGTALSDFPQLERKDILALSVLALKEGQGARLGPCGACAEWIRKVAEVNPEIRIITFKDSSMKRVFVENMPLQ
jgi:cytidine deaminase